MDKSSSGGETLQANWYLNNAYGIMLSVLPVDRVDEKIEIIKRNVRGQSWDRFYTCRNPFLAFMS